MKNLIYTEQIEGFTVCFYAEPEFESPLDVFDPELEKNLTRSIK